MQLIFILINIINIIILLNSIEAVPIVMLQTKRQYVREPFVILRRLLLKVPWM